MKKTSKNSRKKSAKGGRSGDWSHQKCHSRKRLYCQKTNRDREKKRPQRERKLKKNGSENRSMTFARKERNQSSRRSKGKYPSGKKEEVHPSERIERRCETVKTT